MAWLVPCVLSAVLLALGPSAVATGGCEEVDGTMVCGGDYAFGDCTEEGGYAREGTGVLLTRSAAGELVYVAAGGSHDCIEYGPGKTFHRRGVSATVAFARGPDESLPVGVAVVVGAGMADERTDEAGHTGRSDCVAWHAVGIGAAGLSPGASAVRPCPAATAPDAAWGSLLP